MIKKEKYYYIVVADLYRETWAGEKQCDGEIYYIIPCIGKNPYSNKKYELIEKSFLNAFAKEHKNLSHYVWCENIKVLGVGKIKSLKRK